MITQFFETIRLRAFRAVCGFAICVFVLLPCSAEETQHKHNPVVSKLLGKFCLECHDVATADGEREFESFSLPIKTEQQLITADGIIDQVTLRKMPPEDATSLPIKRDSFNRCLAR